METLVFQVLASIGAMAVWACLVHALHCVLCKAPVEARAPLPPNVTHVVPAAFSKRCEEPLRATQRVLEQQVLIAKRLGHFVANKGYKNSLIKESRVGALAQDGSLFYDPRYVTEEEAEEFFERLATARLGAPIPIERRVLENTLTIEQRVRRIEDTIYDQSRTVDSG